MPAKSLMWVGLLTIVMTKAAGATTTALTFGPPNPLDGTIEDLSVNPYTVGWQFTTSAAVNVTSLGWFDDGATAGLNSSHDVGIFDETVNHNLLVSTTVTNADPLTPPQGTEPNFGFVFHTLASPYTLAAGTYVIGGLNPSGTTDGFYDKTGPASTATGVTYVGGLFIPASTLTFPTNASDRGISYFGPNFQFTPVPEPGSIALLGLGAVGLLSAACRRRRAQLAAR